MVAGWRVFAAKLLRNASSSLYSCATCCVRVPSPPGSLQPCVKVCPSVFEGKYLLWRLQTFIAEVLRCMLILCKLPLQGIVHTNQSVAAVGVIAQKTLLVLIIRVLSVLQEIPWKRSEYFCCHSWRDLNVIFRYLTFLSRSSLVFISISYRSTLT